MRVNHDGGRESHALTSGLPLAPGDVVRVVTAQGGGWGAPEPTLPGAMSRLAVP